MPEVVDARAAAGMWDACIFQIPPEVPVNIYQGIGWPGRIIKKYSSSGEEE